MPFITFYYSTFKGFLIVLLAVPFVFFDKCSDINQHWARSWSWSDNRRCLNKIVKHKNVEKEWILHSMKKSHLFLIISVLAHILILSSQPIVNFNWYISIKFLGIKCYWNPSPPPPPQPQWEATCRLQRPCGVVVFSLFTEKRLWLKQWRHSTRNTLALFGFQTCRICRKDGRFDWNLCPDCPIRSLSFSERHTLSLMRVKIMFLLTFLVFLDGAFVAWVFILLK